MSTISVTPLVAGEVAKSADVNSTLTSFNSGTSAGQLNAYNTRVEGIDRRTLSASTHLVGTLEYGNNTTVYVDDTGPIQNASVNWMEVPGLITSSVTVTLPTRLLLHASLRIDGDTATFLSTVRLRVQLRLERSDDGGATWTYLDGTYRSFRFKDLNTATGAAILSTLVTPAIQRSVSWSLYTIPTGAPAKYRVAFKTTDAGDVVGGTDPNIKGATIFIEPYGA